MTVSKAIVVVLSACFGFLTPCFAQTNQKNSKVAEVESYLTQKTIQYIKGRFPDLPVLVSITVDPLRRNESPLPAASEIEILPFYTVQESQRLDEWDDPSKSVHDLLPRIRSVSARISIPNKITDEEIFETRDALFSNLGLIPGRDRIEFERRNWQVDRTEFPEEWLYIIGGSLLILMMGAFVILRLSVGRIEAGLRAVSSSGNDKAAPTPAAAPAAPPPSRETQKSPGFGGELQFNDGLKVAERVAEQLKKLSLEPSFPELSDMIDMEEKAEQDPAFLGAIIQEMPKRMQDEIFMRGSSTSWLRVFFEQSPLNMESYQFVLRLVHRKRLSENKAWTELLVLMWRLGPELINFIGSLSQRDALGILAWMPTAISVPVARKAFPGAWGILLKPDFKPPPLPEDQITDLTQKALQLRPYHSTKMLDQYHHEQGLLSYLRTCSLQEERDIYSASGDNASIRVIRPPFFEVFEYEQSLREELANSINIDTLGKAMFNIDRDLRSLITDFIPQKKKFQFIEVLKACDRDSISAEDVGKARENVARIFNRRFQEIQGDKPRKQQEPAVKEKPKDSAGKPEPKADEKTGNSSDGQAA